MFNYSINFVLYQTRFKNIETITSSVEDGFFFWRISLKVVQKQILLGDLCIHTKQKKLNITVRGHVLVFQGMIFFQIIQFSNKTRYFELFSVLEIRHEDGLPYYTGGGGRFDRVRTVGERARRQGGGLLMANTHPTRVIRCRLATRRTHLRGSTFDGDVRNRPGRTGT